AARLSDAVPHPEADWHAQAARASAPLSIGNLLEQLGRFVPQSRLTGFEQERRIPADEMTAGGEAHEKRVSDLRVVVKRDGVSSDNLKEVPKLVERNRPVCVGQGRSHLAQVRNNRLVLLTRARGCLVTLL